jgi:purine nucleosidase
VTKIHIDTDIAGDMDDLCALAMVLKWPGAEITGVTTVADEGGRRAGYTRYALQLAGRTDIPLAAGADVAGGYYRLIPGYPTEADYWPEPIPPTPGLIEEALDLLKASIEAGATIVAIGPYTNLALLDQRYPGVLGRAKLVLMGGYLSSIPAGFPQWDNEMDWNIQEDVASAQRILEAYTCTIVPMTVTVQTALRRAYLPRLREAGPLAALIARQAEAFARDERNEERLGQTCAGLPNDIINFQHDPLACAVALGWTGATIEEMPVSVETRDGWLHERPATNGRAQRIVTAIDGPAFNQLWYDLLTAE